MTAPAHSRAMRDLSPTRQALLLAALAGGAALAGAYISEHVFGLRPCILCYWQRYGHWAALGAAVVGLLLGGRGGLLLAVVAALGLIASGVVAGFHVGVEQHWWEGTSGCTGASLDFSQSAEDLTSQLLTTEVVRCDEPEWSLFGVTMAGYNLLYSLAAGLLVLALTRRAWKETA